MKRKPPNNAFEEQVRRQLDEQADNLDASTLSRLRQARARALQQSDKRRPVALLWGGGLATAAIFGLSLYLLLSAPGSMDSDITPLITDTDILLEDDGIEFYGELDFYLWLQNEGLDSGEV